MPSAAEPTSPRDFIRRLTATLVAGGVDLPAFPQVVINVQEVLKDPNYTPQALARVISAERSLSDRFLQMANSTAFNATGRVIIDLGLALTRLGAEKVYSVALSHAIGHIRRSDALRPIERRLDELWTESVTVAHFAQVIAKRCSLTVPEAFVAGLLHGIGRFYLLVHGVGRDGSAPVVLSQELIESCHPTLAKMILKNWRIGPAVCEAVGAQSNSALRQGPPALTDVLIAAIRLARRQQNPHDATSLNAGGALARLGLPLEVCEAMIGEATEEVRALQRALRA